MKGFEIMIYDLQKASMLKRVSAFMLDIILMVILITGFAWMLSSALNFTETADRLDNVIASYEDQFGIDFGITSEQYNEMTEEQQKHFDNCYNQVTKDEEYIFLTNKIFYSLITIVSISFFLAHLVLEFIIPLIFKNGQTVGKKVFSIAVMRIDGVKVNPIIMFVRSILGKYTIETMIPTIILIMLRFGVGSYVTLAVLAMIAIFELILVITTKTNSFIHDVLASTVAVDLQSQMIFDSVEAKKEYQLRIHDKEAKNAKYF
jgi:uncharacterized RDD family membrane protein YckC